MFGTTSVHMQVRAGAYNIRPIRNRLSYFLFFFHLVCFCQCVVHVCIHVPHGKWIDISAGRRGPDRASWVQMTGCGTHHSIRQWNELHKPRDGQFQLILWSVLNSPAAAALRVWYCVYRQVHIAYTRRWFARRQTKMMAIIIATSSTIAGSCYRCSG